MNVENVPTHHETMKNDGGTIFSSPTIPIFFSPYYFLNKLCMCVHVHTVRSNSSWPPLDCSPPGFSVYGISQARILEWVAISFSRGSSQPRDWTCVSWVSCISILDSLPLCYPGSPNKIIINSIYIAEVLWNVEHIYSLRHSSKYFLSTKEANNKRAFSLPRYYFSILGHSIILEHT